jgi:hypothetical protein
MWIGTVVFASTRALSVRSTRGDACRESMDSGARRPPLRSRCAGGRATARSSLESVSRDDDDVTGVGSAYQGVIGPGTPGEIGSPNE